jgi:hypothetical protein
MLLFARFAVIAFVNHRGPRANVPGLPQSGAPRQLGAIASRDTSLL